MQDAWDLQLAKILDLDAERAWIEAQPVANGDQLSESGSFLGRDRKTPSHHRKVKSMSVKVRYHRQTDCSAFSGFRLQEQRKVFPLSEPLQLMRKIHDSRPALIDHRP
jgi:hypothetical protein